MAIKNYATQAYNTITKRVDVVNKKHLLEKLDADAKVQGSWGTAPTGKQAHIGYLVPLIRIAECIAAGIDIQILVADSYAYLVNYDVSMDTVEYRSRYYTFLLTAVLKALGVPSSKIHIVQESSFALTADYCRDVMRACAVSTQDEIKAVGLEIMTTPMISPLLCPTHQALCDIYLGSDFQLGGLDQSGMFTYAMNCLPRIGYKPVTYLQTALIPGLKSDKMSSSAQDDTKIMFCDSSDTIRAKTAGADMPQHDMGCNAILAMFEHIVFPAQCLGTTDISVEMKQGSSDIMKQYVAYRDLERDFLDGQINPADMRNVLADALDHILEPIRREHGANEVWRSVEQLSYQPPTKTQ